MKTAHQFTWTVWLGFGLLVLFVASILVPVKSTYALSPLTISAGVENSARLLWEENSVYGSPVPYWPWDVTVRVISGSENVRLVGEPHRTRGPAKLEVALVPMGVAGSVVLQLDTGSSKKDFRLRIDRQERDMDSDGFPDVAELWSDGDRSAFRRWFVAIAESQFYSPDPRWTGINRDCAGLARFAYAQALRKHDAGWLSKIAYLHRWPGEDVKSFNYPDVPILGLRLFRTQPGAFEGADTFMATASARLLWEQNTVFVSRLAKDARMGDLLFFRDLRNIHSPMHTMILLDSAEKGMDRRVVYHTGRDGNSPGEVRIVSLADLNSHADDRWHPVNNNPKFLGFYRWKILDGGKQ